MAGNKYLYNNAGALTEKAAIQSSAGAGDAGKIPALDATGKLDNSLMPVGIGAETDEIQTTDNLSDGDFVNIYSSGGAARCRKADGSVAGKEANGFVMAAFSIGAMAIVYRPSQTNSHRTGMTPGVKQYLSVTAPGQTQETVPGVGGQVIQMLGKGKSSTELIFGPEEVIVLA